MSTAINYARNAAEKSFGRKGLLCIRVELRPCKPQLSKKTPETVNETKKQTQGMQLTLLLYVAETNLHTL